MIDNYVFELHLKSLLEFGTDGEDKLCQTSEIGFRMDFHTKTYSHLLDQFRPTNISLTLGASIYFPQRSSTSKGSELVITCLIDFYLYFPQINDYKKKIIISVRLDDTFLPKFVFVRLLMGPVNTVHRPPIIEKCSHEFCYNVLL